MRRAAWIACAAALLVVTGAGRAVAQRSVIFGVVEDTSGHRLSQVQIEILDTRFTTLTNARGEFVFNALQPGAYRLEIKRLGYRALRTTAQVPDTDTLSLWFALTPSVTSIAPVEVTAAYTSKRLTDVGFDTRRATSNVPSSQFITRADIERVGGADLSNMLRRMTDRARLCARQSAIYVDGVLRGNVVEDPNALPGSRSKAAELASGATFSLVPRRTALDEVSPQLVEGMELYIGGAQMPVDYKANVAESKGQGDQRCVILIWTR